MRLPPSIVLRSMGLPGNHGPTCRVSWEEEWASVGRHNQGKIKGQATGQSHRKGATVGRGQVGHMWVGQCAAAEVLFSQRSLEPWEGRTVSRFGPSRKTPRFALPLSRCLSRGPEIFCASQGWEEKRGLAATRRLHMQCRWVPVQYLWIS